MFDLALAVCLGLLTRVYQLEGRFGWAVMCAACCTGSLYSAFLLP